jgi:hypothetical protein
MKIHHRPDEVAVPRHGEPPPTEPHGGHEGTRFEGVDAKPGLVIWSLAIIGGTLVIVFAFTVGIQKYLQQTNPPGELPSPLAPYRVLAPNPQLQVHPWEELPELRAREEKILNSYGKDPDGRVHIPIDRAMEAVVPHLKVEPNAPQGITTPGGEGRDFAGSVYNLPAPYRKPQIQGEIRKNVQ